MANFIVTCQKVGQALTNWIINIGTPAQKQALCEALRDELGCPIITSDTPSIDISGGGNTLSPLSADVKISAVPGNLIREEIDGLYAGDAAPEDIAALYVSSTSGSDSNPGTKAAPLQTIAEAVRRQAASAGSYRILLKSGDIFVVDSSNITGSNITLFEYYGDSVYPDRDDSPASCVNYAPSSSAELVRPTIRFKQFLIPGSSPPTQNRGNIQGNVIVLSGVIIDIDDTPAGGAPLGGRAVIAEEGIELSGVITTVSIEGSGSAPVFQAPRISCNVSSISLPAGYSLAMPVLPVQVGITFSPGTVTGCGEVPSYTPLISMAAARAQITPDNIVFGSVYDASTKSMFSALPNWDIFASSAPLTLMKRLRGEKKKS